MTLPFEFCTILDTLTVWYSDESESSIQVSGIRMVTIQYLGGVFFAAKGDFLVFLATEAGLEEAELAFLAAAIALAANSWTSGLTVQDFLARAAALAAFTNAGLKKTETFCCYLFGNKRSLHSITHKVGIKIPD